MKCLLLVAHGSWLPETNEEIKRLTDEIRLRLRGRYARVTHAFLEFAQPAFTDEFESCIQSGAKEIVVLPYLLSVGRHVKRDIPELIKAKEAEHPDVRIKLAPYVGSAEGITDLVLSLVP